VSFGVVSVLFAAIFKFLPDVKVPWKHVWLGAVITAALFTVGKYGLTLYFKFASPTSAFGASGSLVAVLFVGLLFVLHSVLRRRSSRRYGRFDTDHRISPPTTQRKIKANNADATKSDATESFG